MKKLSTLLCAIFFIPLCAFAQEPRTAFVHLFEWQWNDIATECETVLGPKGFSAVQVSPPQKSVSGSQWWTRYQPVSYSIEGRSGTRAEFASMVARCKAVGVDIYVDAVINHMAAWSRSFPEVPYSASDFHTCTANINYADAWSIQNCDLSGLNDLKTESDYVRGKIAGYLNDLTSLGVAGFRIDAAKHIASADIANIKARLTGNPYIFQEVIGGAGEPVTPSQYTFIGDVTEFNYTNTLGNYFKGRGALKELKNILTWSGWLASSDAVVFVANHDNQRQNTSNIITHKDGADVNNLAHVFMLAFPYGYPKVMSSYDWADHDQGPPSSGASACNNGWLCEHRNRAIANMVGFRNHTQAAFYLSNWWDNGANQIAFGRGSLGFVVLNGESFSMSTQLQTGLPMGKYCDLVNGDFANGNCSGPTISVDANGLATFTLSAKKASAIDVTAVVTDGGNNCVYTSMNMRGTFNSWAAAPMTCTNGVWMGAATFGGAATDRFKFDAYGDWATNWGDSNSDLVANMGGSDIYVPVAGTYAVTFNDASLQYTLTNQTQSSVSSSAVSSAASSQASSSLTSVSSSSVSSSSSTVNVTFTCNNGSTYLGQSVYVVGDQASLGAWSPAGAVKLSAANYPTWTGTISLPANTSVQWKCLKREEANASAGLVWQSGANNSLNTATATSASASF